MGSGLGARLFVGRSTGNARIAATSLSDQWSYGTNHGAQWRRSAEIVALILKGAKPTDIPVEQPTKFELVVNLKTAKASNFTVPPTIMLRADEVIE
jgi:ABC-type uncharacterized transport system substrate-binding protein